MHFSSGSHISPEQKEANPFTRTILAQNTPMLALEKILEFCDGDCDATTVIVKFVSRSHFIDPSINAKDLISQMKEYGITKERICRFYRDVCGEEFGRMIGLLRACKLDIITQSALLHAIDNNGEGINVDEVVNKVRQQTRSKATESHSGTHIEIAPESGIVSEICGDNPFAKEVVDKLFTESSQIDPSISPNYLILQMKEYGITGERIWHLYKDVCSKNIGKMIRTLSEWVLGGNLPPQLLLNIIDKKVRDTYGEASNRGSNFKVTEGSNTDEILTKEKQQQKGKATELHSGTEPHVNKRLENKLKNEIHDTVTNHGAVVETLTKDIKVRDNYGESSTADEIFEEQKHQTRSETTVSHSGTIGGTTGTVQRLDTDTKPKGELKNEIRDTNPATVVRNRSLTCRNQAELPSHLKQESPIEEVKQKKCLGCIILYKYFYKFFLLKFNHLL